MFETDLNFVIAAIVELLIQMDMNPPQLGPQQLGPVVTTYCGNGRWQQSSSLYFNCGVNRRANVPGQVGEKGHLSGHDGHCAAYWFENQYRDLRANVLQSGNKWNFTLVKNGRAFNFHLIVG